MNKFLYSFIAEFMRILKIILLILCFITLFAQLSSYVKNVNKYPAFAAVLKVENSVNKHVKENIPTVINNYDASRWITLILFYILASIASRISGNYRYYADLQKYHEDLENWKDIKKNHTKNEKVLIAEKKYQELIHAKKNDRGQLLKDFVALKKELETMGRDLAFLAIDVVDSTGMKQGEESAIVQYDFQQYHDFVDERFKKFNCIKSTWTPDGVMACFDNVDEAVGAARTILKDLPMFNQEVKSMKRDFAVRCGINAGYIYYDENMPLETIADRVIDVAGHMQKHAEPNTICISKSFIEPILDKAGFKSANREVDGYEVSMWKG